MSPSPIRIDTTPDPRARLTQYELPTAATLAQLATDTNTNAPAQGAITRAELRACAVIDLAETIREPLSPERLAKGAVKIAAALARAWRD
jgi:hypothetical protein